MVVRCLILMLFISNERKANDKTLTVDAPQGFSSKPKYVENQFFTNIVLFIILFIFLFTLLSKFYLTCYLYDIYIFKIDLLP